MKVNSPIRPVDILLVEDSPSDAELTVEALSDGKVLNNLHWVEDGVEALAFLRRQGKYNNAPRPDLILLDLNLPKKDARDVLAEIKTDPCLKLIPVVILITSVAESINTSQ
jgi:CheY-like chemotaxis protein